MKPIRIELRDTEGNLIFYWYFTTDPETYKFPTTGRRAFDLGSIKLSTREEEEHGRDKASNEA